MYERIYHDPKRSLCRSRLARCILGMGVGSRASNRDNLRSSGTTRPTL
ncbi:unnamed protein product [Toxocara canis]|uniref:Uncharacterized protein n=1 Tax=Toxocara canis TaxID=6265 RepID=A0A183V6Q2_TOXCA|nr:unnamed protein product [Toxocara canis]